MGDGDDDESQENRNRQKNIKKITSKSILALRETEGGGLLLPPNFCQTCGSSFFALCCYFLYFYIYWIPYFHIYLLLKYFPPLQIVGTGHFYLQIVVTNYFSNGHTRLTFLFFKLLQHRIACICKLLYVQPHVTGGLNWPSIYFDQAESTDYVVQMMCMCTRTCQLSERGRRGTLVHI